MRDVVDAGIQVPARWAGAQVGIHPGISRVKPWDEHWTFRTRCPVTAEMSPFLVLSVFSAPHGVGLGGFASRLSIVPSVCLEARQAPGVFGCWGCSPL